MKSSSTDNAFITRSDGTRFPSIGYGTFQLEGDDDTAAAVKAALDTGYRLIDTAANYGNEIGIGEGVRTSHIPRDEVFVSSKVWPSELGYDKTLRAFDETITRLNLDYVDIFLIHWPCTHELNAASWKAIERLYSEGLIRFPGVSNFTIQHLEVLLQTATVVPVVNQIEFHPLYFDQALNQFCREREILVEAWSPLMQGTALSDAELARIAQKYNRTPAQIVLRWSVQMGAIPLPKTRNPARMRENFAIFDFQLDDDDMATIAKMFTGQRFGPDPESYQFCS